MTQTPDIKPRSRDVTDGLEKAAARGDAPRRRHGRRRLGQAADRRGVARWNEITPCNLSLDRLAKAVKDGVHAAGGYPLEFGTISVSDGISMGHEGMHFSLVSREVIADSVETVMHGRAPRRLGAARRLRQVAARHADGRGPPRPAVGLPLRRLDPARASVDGQGRHDHRRLRGRRRLRRRHDDAARSVDAIERAICPGEGACGGMYTANTMAVGRRGDRHVAARARAAPAGRRPPPRRLRHASPARPSSSCSRQGITRARRS